MKLEFYYDVVCPFAYLASTQIEAFACHHGVDLVWRPVLLGGIYQGIEAPQNPMTAMSPAKARHNALDMQRWADWYGVGLRMPAAHPRRSVDAMRLLVGAPVDAVPRLTHALYRAYWVDGLDIADRGVLAQIAAANGVDPDIIGSSTARQALFGRSAEAVAIGAFGVPTFRLTDVAGVDEATSWWGWGQDRLDFVAAAIRRARQGSLKPQVEVFHDFSSPFSYLGATQIGRIAEAAGAELTSTPILLGGLFRALGTPDVPLMAMSAPRQAWVARDLGEWAARWNVPFRFTSHFPIRTVTALRAAIVEPRLAPSLYRAVWADDRNLSDPAVVAAVIAEAGHDAAAILADARTPEVKARLRANTDRAAELGVFGVPTFRLTRSDREPILVWGQDRLVLVERVLDGWWPDCG